MKAKILYILLSILSGVIISLSWPANGISYFSFIAFVPLLYLINKRMTEGKSIITTWPYIYLTMVIWNLLTTYWVYYSSPEGSYVAFFLNAYIMSLMWTFSLRARKVFDKRKGYIALILFWLTYEYLHLDWELSWPWLQIGNVFANTIEIIQWYEYTGLFGGTLWVLIINILVFEIILDLMHKKSIVKKSTLVGIILLVPITFSLIRYYTYEEKSNLVSFILVQPNVDPWGKFGSISSAEQMYRIIDLASPLLTENTDYVIAPETAVPVLIDEAKIDTNESIELFKTMLTPYPNTQMITGVTTIAYFENPKEAPSTATKIKGTNNYFDDYNSTITIDNFSKCNIYHKSKLVPGPEKFPFGKILKPFQDKLFGNLGGMIGDLGTQKEREVFPHHKKNIKVAPIICYETIYGAFVGEFVKNGANIITLSTNDAWWGDSPGYKQLLAYTRLRSIETRRSIARSANTGITCFINQRGDIIQPTKYLERIAIKGEINANDEITFYVNYGDLIGRICMFGAFIFFPFMYIRMFLKKKNLN